MALAETTLAEMTLADMTLAETTLADVVVTGLCLDLAEPARAASERDQGRTAPGQPRSAPARVSAADATFEAALQLDLTARAVVR